MGISRPSYTRMTTLVTTAADETAARPPSGMWAGKHYRPRWAEKKEQDQ